MNLDDVFDDDDLDEDPARISPDARALSPDLAGLPDLVGPFSRSRRISRSGWPFLQISPNLKKKRADIDLLFFVIFFKTKLQTLATCVRNKWLKVYHFSFLHLAT